MESKNLIILIELILWLEIKKARYKTLKYWLVYKTAFSQSS